MDRYQRITMLLGRWSLKDFVQDIDRPAPACLAQPDPADRKGRLAKWIRVYST